MALQPDPATKGLWRSPDPDPAGVHALIVGISDYPHLDGGPESQRAPDTAAMGQLAVSAKTAAKVFDWLRQVGRVAGAPVQTCRLLLAPHDADEQAAVAAITGGAHADARFETLRAAIMAWGDDLIAGGHTAAPNVALFFFSGHGFEHVSQPSLLAQDILAPTGQHGRRNAVSFNALWQSVRTYGVGSALFFVDACRNAPDIAKRLNIVGENVLEPLIDAAEAPEATVWLQATRSGNFAYQLAGTPATLFGQALLEGLAGLPPDWRPYDCAVTPWRLVFRDLEAHVKQRVRALIAQYSATKLQPVEPGGYPYNGDALVAEKDPGTGAPPPGPVTTEALGPIALQRELAARAADVLASFRATTPDDILGARLKAMRSDPNRSRFGDLADPFVMHEILKHESATEPFIRSLTILDVATGQPVEPDTVTVAEAKTDETIGALTAWIDVTVEPGGGDAVWIAAAGEDPGNVLAVAIPRDQSAAVPVRLDLQFDQRPDLGRWVLQAMTARLAEPSAGPTVGGALLQSYQEDVETRPLWRALFAAQRMEALISLDRAAEELVRSGILRSALDRERPSPLAAAIAATVLLRAGALEALWDWPRRLADEVVWLPDGPVLWAETLLQRRAARSRGPRGARPALTRPRSIEERLDDLRRAAREEDTVAARDAFAQMAYRGVPRLAPVLAMAARQADHWRQLLDVPDLLEPHETARLAAACDLIDRAASIAVPDGLFAAFVSHAGALDPRHVLGMPASRPEPEPAPAMQ
ncbi:MAG: hypothetical protein HXX10_28470 [Rhodoplanes sp.]|uniref:caspase family protein n=1 Tax=Rhodoplanes sp. TaxID=1968906 RepID=UPI00182F01E1|nr:caspase family protein [Rhodoplanes sp.]NVO17974.1 hypothetical protein [Rhodoplanes sp.]